MSLNEGLQELSVQLQTPPSSDNEAEQDEVEDYGPYDLNANDLVEEEEEPPRQLKRTHARMGEKRPRVAFIEEEDDEGPDLAAYFALFPSFTELDQVKYLRAHANALSAKKPANRMRYSHQKLQ